MITTGQPAVSPKTIRHLFGVRAASFVENGKPVMFEPTDDGIELNMEPEDLTELVTVIRLDIESALN